MPDTQTINNSEVIKCVVFPAAFGANVWDLKNHKLIYRRYKENEEFSDQPRISFFDIAFEALDTAVTVNGNKYNRPFFFALSFPEGKPHFTAVDNPRQKWIKDLNSDPEFKKDMDRWEFGAGDPMAVRMYAALNDNKWKTAWAMATYDLARILSPIASRLYKAFVRSERPPSP